MPFHILASRTCTCARFPHSDVGGACAAGRLGLGRRSRRWKEDGPRSGKYFDRVTLSSSPLDDVQVKRDRQMAGRWRKDVHNARAEGLSGSGGLGPPILDDRIHLGAQQGIGTCRPAAGTASRAIGAERGSSAWDSAWWDL